VNLSDLIRRLDDLAARLEKVERALGLQQPARPKAPEARREPAPPPTAPPVTPPKAPPTAPPTAPPVRPAPSPVRGAPAAQPRRAAPVERAKRGPALDVRIGQRLLAWAGSIMIVIGIGYLVKYGYDEGWWGRVPPVFRCLAVAGFGGLLLLAGELTMRRLGPAASVGLFGAGLGTLYLDAYATFAWLEPPLVAKETAFILMGVVALIGFGLTLRTAFLTIGVLSLVGGYLTLWLLGGPVSHVIEIGAYLTMLLGVALALSGAMARKFRTLRYVALAGHGVIGLWWVIGAVTHSWFVALFFASIWWVMVLVETLVAALRRQSSVGNVVASLLTTAWYVTVGCWVLAGWRPAGVDWLGAFTACVGVLAILVAFQFGPRVSELGRPQTAIDRLAVALWAQAGLLVTVAIALQFDGYGQSIGWLAVGLGSIEIGRRLRLGAVEIFGLVLWALAIGRVAFLDSQLPTLRGVVWSQSYITISHWSLLALAAVAITHVAAQRISKGGGIPAVLASARAGASPPCSPGSGPWAGWPFAPASAVPSRRPAAGCSPPWCYWPPTARGGASATSRSASWRWRRPPASGWSWTRCCDGSSRDGARPRRFRSSTGRWPSRSRSPRPGGGPPVCTPSADAAPRAPWVRSRGCRWAASGWSWAARSSCSLR
jgi:hypothetical protein